MTHSKRNPLPTTLALIVVITGVIMAIGCITTNPPQTPINQTTFLPAPTPNPYGLDTDGYYIADHDTQDGYFAKGWIYLHLLGYLDKDDELTTNQTNLTDFAIKQNITIPNPTITSGEAVIITGTSTLPINTLIPITIDPLDCRPTIGGTGAQYFSAPILPGTNGTNLIKIKIPALDIHLNSYTDYSFYNSTIFSSEEHTNKQFPQNDTYDTVIFIGSNTVPELFRGKNLTIISDTNHPMIWTHQSHENSFGRTNPAGRTRNGEFYYWHWTNDTTTQHQVYVFYTPEEYWCDTSIISGDIYHNLSRFQSWFESNRALHTIHRYNDINPFPTYPHPPKTWDKTTPTPTPTITISENSSIDPGLPTHP
jgi:hypothetical protein